MNRPNDERHFVHKTLLRGVSALTGIGAAIGIPGAGTVSAITGRLGGRGGRQPLLPLPVQTGRGGPCPQGTLGCPPCPAGTVPDPQGRGFCVARTSTFGKRSGAAVDFGEAVMGQFGAALEPAVRMTDTRVCPRGTVLGMDGLCYNKRDLKNAERLWPKGRAPLLTGGEMRCISIASRAANKLARKQKQLRDMGMLPPLPKARRAKALPAGHHAHVAHN